jgi:hypothetical protein
VPNTEFEGGDDGHGYGDYTFLVKQAQSSHNKPTWNSFSLRGGGGGLGARRF